MVDEVQVGRGKSRDDMTQQIKDVARGLLIGGGYDAVKLRAIAREMRLTAPALYRYFDGRDALLVALITDLYDELTASLATTAEAEPGDAHDRLDAASRAFRSWALEHPQEFGLIFGTPGRGVEVPADGPVYAANRRFSSVFVEQFVALSRDGCVPGRHERDLSSDYQDQLRTIVTRWGAPDLPPASAQVFLSSWVRIYGLVSLEVFGHLMFLDGHADDMFEAELRDIRRTMGHHRPV